MGLTRRQAREAAERASVWLGWRRFRKAVVAGLVTGLAAVAGQLPGIDLAELTVQGGATRITLTLLGSFAGAAGVYWTRNAATDDGDG